MLSGFKLFYTLGTFSSTHPGPMGGTVAEPSLKGTHFGTVI
jgi:hypothetical protein